MVSTLEQLGFKRTAADDSVFVCRQGDKLTIVATYVDDLLFASNNKGMLNNLKSRLASFFDISDLSFPVRFLGLEVENTKTHK